MKCFTQLKKSLMAFCALLLASGAWAESVTTNGVTWTFSVVNGQAVLKDKSIPTSTSGVLEIPSTLGGYPVVGIKSGAFQNCSRLTEVIIPASVTDISWSGYNSDTSYTPFNGCTGLVSVVLNGNVATNYASISPFNGCVNLTNVVTRSAPRYMFKECPKLQSVTLLEGCAEIGREAFELCTNLTSITIPTSVTNLGYEAFASCHSLSSVAIYADLRYDCCYSGSYSYKYYFSDLSAFYGCKSLTNVISRSAGTYLFYGLTNLKSATLLDGTSSIGDSAFHWCSSLTDISIPNSVTSIGGWAFYGCSSLSSVRIPNGLTDVGKSAFHWCSSLLDVSVPQCVCKSSMADVFPSSYSSMTNVVVSDGVTCIGTNCFADCTALRTVTIPASVTSIGSRAFSNCASLEKIVFLGNAPDMGEEVFFGTPRTMAVEVPQGSIGWSGGVSGELPATFGDRGIVYSSGAGSELGGDDGAGGGDGGSGSGSGSGGGAGGGNGGGSGAGDARYELADAPRDRAIASMVVDGDVSLDAFDLSDGRVFDAAVRIVNVAGRSVKVSLPAGFAYEKFRGTSPLVLPAASTNLLTITRVGESTFFVSRGELVAEDAQ